ncbi:MAG: hypothetical protein ABIQ30_18395 [Devosia sp.]
MNTTLKLSTIALLAALLSGTSVSALSINLGGGDAPLVDLGNGNNADATISVDTGTALGGGSSSTGNIDAAVNLGLGSNGGSDASVVNSGGTGGLLNLGGDGGLANLGSHDDSEDADLLDIETGGRNGSGNGRLLDLANADATLNLGGNGRLLDLGTSNAPTARISINTDPIITGSTGNGRTGTGPVGTNGTNASGLGGVGSVGGSAGSRGPQAIPPVACLTMDDKQVAQLVTGHEYGRATFNSWSDTRSLQVVELNLCNGADTEISAAVASDANVARLQTFLAGQVKVKAGLKSEGHAPGDVIAADNKGSVLIVYVL